MLARAPAAPGCYDEAVDIRVYEDGRPVIARAAVCDTGTHTKALGDTDQGPASGFLALVTVTKATRDRDEDSTAAMVITKTGGGRDRDEDVAALLNTHTRGRADRD
jgi:hypothetical protein